MNLRLRNTWKYNGNGRWDWSVFVEDDGTGDINTVLSVEYILHPTFPNPRRIVTNKEDKFRLKTNGWGVFLILAFANTKEGKKIKLQHVLEMQYDPSEGTSV